jgi:hypothetical protein
LWVVLVSRSPKDVFGNKKQFTGGLGKAWTRTRERGGLSCQGPSHSVSGGKGVPLKHRVHPPHVRHPLLFEYCPFFPASCRASVTTRRTRSFFFKVSVSKAMSLERGTDGPKYNHKNQSIVPGRACLRAMGDIITGGFENLGGMGHVKNTQKH